MSKSKDSNTQKEWRLAEFQVRFVEEFLKPGSSKCHLLIATPGVGKGLTTAHLISRLLRAGGKRVLILCPASLVPAWYERVGSLLAERTVLAIDRRLFLERQSEASPGQDPWPDGVIIVSTDMAKREAVTASLVESTWDLVIVDEAHKMTGQKQLLLERLANSGEVSRFLMLTASQITEQINHCLKNTVHITNWKADFVRWRDSQKSGDATTEVRPIWYTRSEDELTVLKALDVLLEEIPTSEAAVLIRRIILYRAASSILNLENTLIRIRRQLDEYSHESSPLHEFPEVIEEGATEEGLWRLIPDCVAKIERLLLLLENVTVDMKLTSLMELIDRMSSEESAQRIVILSSFASTIEYLRAAMQDRGFVAFSITGRMTHGQRDEAFRGFRDQGRILMTTDASVIGSDLTFVDTVIHYDLPTTVEQVGKRRAVYDGITRVTPCIVYAFLDESRVFPFESERFRGLSAQLYNGRND